ncbi:hypothetical protein CsNV_019 [Callinectes sapidus nudivirus]|nr:hypothetical protein CsNV_019 [Callinectes sapidus nudivirus]
MERSPQVERSGSFTLPMVVVVLLLSLDVAAECASAVDGSRFIPNRPSLSMSLISYKPSTPRKIKITRVTHTTPHAPANTRDTQHKNPLVMPYQVVQGQIWTIYCALAEHHMSKYDYQIKAEMRGR